MCSIYTSESVYRVLQRFPAACLHTLSQHSSCVWCTHTWTKAMNPIEILNLMSNDTFLFKIYKKCIFIFKLFDLMWVSLCLLLKLEFWFDWTFIMSETHTDFTLKKGNCSPIPPSHSAEVLSPHMALNAIPRQLL